MHRCLCSLCGLCGSGAFYTAAVLNGSEYPGYCTLQVPPEYKTPFKWPLCHHCVWWKHMTAMKQVRILCDSVFLIGNNRGYWMMESIETSTQLRQRGVTAWVYSVRIGIDPPRIGIDPARIGILTAVDCGSGPASSLMVHIYVIWLFNFAALSAAACGRRSRPHHAYLGQHVPSVRATDFGT